MNIYEKLMQVQSKLKVSKENFNAFGKYKYRSCEDILEGVKPILKEVGAIITLSDIIELIGDRHYIKATATFMDTEKGEKLEVSAYAREDEALKGMSASQVTGSASSYARKYSLNGLLSIDDTKDSDATNDHGKGDTPTTDLKPASGTKPPSNTIISQDMVQALTDLGKKHKPYVSLGIIKERILTEYKKTSIESLTLEEYNAIKTRLEK